MTNFITSVGVQQFSITIASGSTTGTATITGVGSGAFIIYGGINPSVSNNPAEDFAYLTLTNSTTITATRNTGTAGTAVITGCIIDGDTTNLIKSVQFGTVAIATAATSGTASISAVTNANTAIHLLGWASANTTFSALREGPVLSLSGTTVTATRPASTGALTVGFVAIEFQGSALNQSVQSVAATSSSSVTSYTASITSVIANNAICIYGGSGIGTVTTNVAQYKQRGSLTNSTTFTVNVNTAVADAKSYNASVVEFVSGVLNSAVQRGTTTLTGVTSNTTPLTSVNESYSGVSNLGNTATSTTAVLDRSEGAATLTTAIPATALVHTSGGNAASGSGFSVTSSTSGNLLVAVINLLGGGTTSSVTDNKGQTWSKVAGAYGVDTTSGTATDIWYFPNTTGGVTSVTATTSGGFGSYNAVIYEVSGMNTSSPLDGTGQSLSNQAATATMLTPAITTTAANDFIVTIANSGSGTVSTVNAPYTLDSITLLTAFHIPNSTVSGEQATFNWNSSVTWCGSTAAFLQSTVANDVVQVTKATATANITSSWEVFEFPAFSSISQVLNAIWFGAIA